MWPGLKPISASHYIHKRQWLTPILGVFDWNKRGLSPNCTAISDVAEALKGSGVPIIADGGIRYSGDLA
ncbi:MAG: IMP dehydrogenase, partial [Pseudomonadales bacterium]|nr:IMP dehydrogenase [Pseudomonadales bacterium]